MINFAGPALLLSGTHGTRKLIIRRRRRVLRGYAKRRQQSTEVG